MSPMRPARPVQADRGGRGDRAGRADSATQWIAEDTVWSKPAWSPGDGSQLNDQPEQNRTLHGTGIFTYIDP